MGLFRNLKLKLKQETPKVEHLETSSNISKEIKVTGNRSEAFGVRDFPIPTGICSNPISAELKEYIKNDKLGQLLCNPIYHCIFYNTSTGYCFFSGDCIEKQNIDESLVEQYKNDMKKIINEKYGNE